MNAKIALEWFEENRRLFLPKTITERCSQISKAKPDPDASFERRRADLGLLLKSLTEMTDNPNWDIFLAGHDDELLLFYLIKIDYTYKWLKCMDRASEFPDSLAKTLQIVLRLEPEECPSFWLAWRQ